VETCVVLMTIFVVIYGLFDFGLLTLRQNMLDDAARRIARTAVLRSEDSVHGAWGPVSIEGQLIDDPLIVEAIGPAKYIIHEDDIQVEIEWPDDANSSNARVVVQLSYDHPLLFAGFWGLESVPLRSRASDRLE